MPVMPKRTKYRKMQKGRNRGRADKERTCTGSCKKPRRKQSVV